MVEERKRLHRQAMAELRHRDARFLNTAIPYRAEIERMGETRKPIVAHRPKCRWARRPTSALWRECRRLTAAASSGRVTRGSAAVPCGAAGR